MTGGPAEDVFEMGSRRPRARTSCAAAAGGTPSATRKRTTGVNVSVGHGTRDDGAAGEGDDVTGVEQV